MSRHLTLYLGFDGAYVLSRYPLKRVTGDADSVGDFLSGTRKSSCFDVQPSEAVTIGLTSLKLKKYEVVKLKIEATKPRLHESKKRDRPSISVSAAAHGALRVIAESEGKSMAQVVEEWVEGLP
jgi:hypothetical protein